MAKVAARYPRLRIIIDHMGRLRGMKDVSFKLDKTDCAGKVSECPRQAHSSAGMLLRPLSIQQYPTRGAPTNRRLFAASGILGHGSLRAAQPLSCDLSPSSDHVYRRAGIFAGRSRMDHGARHFRMSALARGANPGARRLDRNAGVCGVRSHAPTCCGRRRARCHLLAQQLLS